MSTTKTTIIKGSLFVGSGRQSRISRERTSIVARSSSSGQTGGHVLHFFPPQQIPLLSNHSSLCFLSLKMTQKVVALKGSLELFLGYLLMRCVLREAGADAQKYFFSCTKSAFAKLPLSLPPPSSFSCEFTLNKEQPNQNAW